MGASALGEVGVDIFLGVQTCIFAQWKIAFLVVRVWDWKLRLSEDVSGSVAFHRAKYEGAEPVSYARDSREAATAGCRSDETDF